MSTPVWGAGGWLAHEPLCWVLCSHYLKSWQQPIRLYSPCFMGGETELQEGEAEGDGLHSWGWWSQACGLQLQRLSLLGAEAYQRLPALFMPLREGSPGKGF